MDDRWPWLRRMAESECKHETSPMEATKALAILDAVTAPGTEVFDIVRWTRPNGEERVDMPADVLGFLRTQLSLTWNQMRGRLLNEIDGIAYKWDMPAEIESRLAARYEAATPPPPPKWETALREYFRQADPYDLSECLDGCIDAVRAGLAEEQGDG